MATQRTKFTYEPLDTTRRSIRLISVDPELSPEGFVQCSIRHTNIDVQTRYNCLSYRWGPSDLSNIIIVNGQALSINGYLHDFLTQARTFTYQAPGQSMKRHIRDSLWVDAVCIDQNSMIERNHQVAQMGKIYINAYKVIVWLGNRYTDDITLSKRFTRYLPSTDLSRYYKFIAFNKYWTRAWITQEVMLAQDPVIMIADDFSKHLIPFVDLVERHGIHSKRELQWAILHKAGSRDVFLARKNMAHFRGNAAKKPRILDWLDQLHGVECAVIHDRIYSLLELAGDGRNIPVDYNMSVAELVYHVLGAGDREVCLCEVRLLNRVLKTANEAIDRSRACVFVQWQPGSSYQLNSDECATWLKRGSTSKFGHTVIRAPLQYLQVYFGSPGAFEKLCYGALHGKPAWPAQVKLGRVYEWQLVLGDRTSQGFPLPIQGDLVTPYESLLPAQERLEIVSGTNEHGQEMQNLPIKHLTETESLAPPPKQGILNYVFHQIKQLIMAPPGADDTANIDETDTKNQRRRGEESRLEDYWTWSQL